MIVGAGVSIHVGTMDVIGQSNRGECVVVAENIVFGDGELKVEDVEKLALDAADIALAKHARTERPVDVFESGVIEVLRMGHG